MSDSESRKTLGVIVECAKLTPEIFAKAIEDMIKNISDKQPQGKTSLNKLMKTGKVDSIEVNDSNIGSFAQTARKYNLTYALKRVQDENGKKQYLVCFHGRDLDTMQKAFQEYSYKQTHKKETLFSKKKVAEIQVSAPELFSRQGFRHYAKGVSGIFIQANAQKGNIVQQEKERSSKQIER